MKLLGFKFGIYFVSLLTGILLSSASYAEEKKEEKQEEKKINQYYESISALNGQLEKIRENTEKMDRLITEKNNSVDQTRIGEIILEISTLEKENKKLTKSARQLQYDIKYLYPDKGEETSRLYKKQGIPELTEKDELSFAERIDGVLTTAKKVYGPTEADIRAKEEAQKRKIAEEEKKKHNPKYRFERIRIKE